MKISLILSCSFYPYFHLSRRTHFSISFTLHGYKKICENADERLQSPVWIPFRGFEVGSNWNPNSIKSIYSAFDDASKFDLSLQWAGPSMNSSLKSHSLTCFNASDWPAGHAASFEDPYTLAFYEAFGWPYECILMQQVWLLHGVDEMDIGHAC